MKGCLRGPLDREALAKPGRWIPRGRFAVVQGAKTRPIDDYTLSKVNAAVSTCESIDPADIDHIAANCRAHADAPVAGSQHRSPSSPFQPSEAFRTSRWPLMGHRERLSPLARVDLPARACGGRGLESSDTWSRVLPAALHAFRGIFLCFSVQLGCIWVELAPDRVVQSWLLQFDDFSVVEASRLAESA